MTTATVVREAQLKDRIDLQIIVNLVETGAQVLDLGCGDGSLLELLVEQKRAIVRGVEISDDGVRECIRKGLVVYHGDLDEGLGDYPDNSFDYVILSQTLQTVHKPLLVLQEMLRVGRIGIVSFPNFGYWKIQWQLMATGRMPKADFLPYEWYDTPNIHLLTIKDFQDFCVKHQLIVDEALFLTDGKRRELFPNLLAKLAVFVIRRD